jgi:long-chain acyl-CoA synthetase
MNPCDALVSSAEATPDKVAIIAEGRPLSYGAFADAALRFARALSLAGVRRGDAVGIMLPNLSAFPVCAYGAWALGAVVVPMNVLLTAREVSHIVRDSRLRALVTTAFSLPAVREALAALDAKPLCIVAGPQAAEGERALETMFACERLAAPVQISAHTHVLTLYTSGTTGTPKGAMISARNLREQSAMMSESFPIAESDRLLCVLPLFHAFALNALLQTAVLKGGTIVLHPKFEVAACMRSLAEERISWFAAVPTMYAYLMAASEDKDVRFPALRYCVSGGAGLPVELGQRFKARFGVPVYEGYGLTETTVGVSTNRPGSSQPGSVGKPYPGVEVRIVDEQGRTLPTAEHGEITVRGPNVMLGYLNQPEASEAVLRDGWFATSDLGFIDHEGFLHIAGRKSDLIIKGGYNIYPREVEEVLARHPGVSDAAVLGVPDELKGELVSAFVAPRDGLSIDEEELRAHCALFLAKYKHPNHFHFVPRIPRGPTGKVLRRELAAAR